jgi:hypothetical protein
MDDSLTRVRGRTTRTVDALGGWSAGTATLTGAGDAERIRTVTATASL